MRRVVVFAAWVALSLAALSLLRPTRRLSLVDAAGLEH